MPALDFTLMTDAGSPLALSSLRGRRVVLYFYPVSLT
jgi:peroxiredoxin